MKLELIRLTMFKWFLRIFCVFGFYPIFEKYHFGLITTSVNFLIIMGLIIYVGVNQKNILYSATPIGNINDILVLFSLYAAHLVSIVETYLKRKYLTKFWEHYKKVDKLIKPKTKWKETLFVKSVLFCIFVIAIEAAVITNISSDTQWTTYWYHQIFSLFMTRLRHFQQIFFIEIIFNYLQECNRILSSLLLWTRSLENSELLAKKHFQTKIRELKHAYRHLMTMIICINRVFCWSQVLNFGQIFIEVTCEFYWVYVFSMTTEDFLWRKLDVICLVLFVNNLIIFNFLSVHISLASLIVFLPSLLVIFMLLQSATLCIKEVRFLTAIFSMYVAKAEIDFSRLCSFMKKHHSCFTRSQC